MTESVPDRESSENERSQLADSSVRSRKRIRRLLVVGSLLILLFGPYLFYRATSFGERVRVFSEDGPVAVAPETLRVMIWNIAHGRGVEDSNWSETAEPKVDRILEIAELIKQQDADVVILNEVDYAATWSGNFDQAAAIADVTGYPYYARQTNLDFGFLVGRSNLATLSSVVTRLSQPKHWTCLRSLPGKIGWWDANADCYATFNWASNKSSWPDCIWRLAANHQESRPLNI